MDPARRNAAHSGWYGNSIHFYRKKAMEKRPLGQSGIAIAPFVFGGNVFGWTADETRSFELLDRYAERGFNAVDTADVYSAWAPGNAGGESETIIGRWLAR